MDSPGHWGHYFLQSLLSLVCEILIYILKSEWPRGLMDKASDFESEDWEFEFRRGRLQFSFLYNILFFRNKILQSESYPKNIFAKYVSNWE